MKEQCFNLFLFITNDYVRELGAVAHDFEGSDDDKLSQLQRLAPVDATDARRYPVPSRYMTRQEDRSFTPGIDYRTFQRMTNGGRLFEVFHEVLQELGAGASPMVCVTPVVDGVVRIDQVGKLPEIANEVEKIKVTRFAAPDYLRVYLTEEGFDLGGLLNDDYFRAIKLLYRERLFVSAAKLLMSFIDTVSYVHDGDSHGNFQRWLNRFVDLNALGITADELWELRNSLLHMTNIDSRKVVAGRVRRLLFFVGTMPSGFGRPDGDLGYFNLYDLITAIIEGVSKWTKDLNREPKRITELVDRYDRVLSDIRYEVLSHAPLEESEAQSVKRDNAE